MAKPWWIWIVVAGVMVVCLLSAVVAGRIARGRSGLDAQEMEVVRRAGAVGRDELIGGALGQLTLAALQLPPVDLRAFRRRGHRAAASKAVGFNPRERNRAEGVIFWFHELRLTRTELIRGYEEDAERIPLRGLTATVTTGHTVYITIEGPATKFIYRNAFDAATNLGRAQQFAALLNYEASRQDAPR